MTAFVLIDLYQQLPFLPPQMKTWSRERMLRWLRVYGEVGPVVDPFEANASDERRSWFRDAYQFRSWVGLQTGFVLRGPGDLFIPGIGMRAWVN
jgi:hypothetical protein